MSSGWDSYTQRLKDHKLDKCGIHGKADGCPWSQVPEFKCSTEEIAHLSKCMTTCPDEVRANGAMLGGQKWTMVRELPDDECMMFKGKDGDNCKQTLVCGLSRQAVIIGCSSDENVQSSAILKEIIEVQEYLKKCNY